MLLSVLLALVINQITSPSLPEGIWETQGYGYIFDVQKSNITVYDELGDESLSDEVLTPTQFHANFGDWEDISAGQPRKTWRLQTSGMRVKALASLPAACVHPLAHDARPLVNFDYFWQTFKAHYAFFAQHGVNWDAVRAELRPKAATLPDDGDVFPILADMVARLRDTHVGLFAGNRSFGVRKYPRWVEDSPGGPVFIDDHYMLNGLRAYMTGANTPLIRPAENVGNGQVLYGRIKAVSAAKDAVRPSSEYGYIALFGMKEFDKTEGRDTPDDESVNSARLAMKQAISALRGVKGVIIDLRYNGGGGDAVAVAIAGFFTDRPVKAYSKRVYYNGKAGEPYQVVVRPENGERLSVPIAILTSDFTVSAAEVGVLALKALPRCIQIGQPTRGSFSDRLHKVMPNGWTISLSNEIYADKKGRVFEVCGAPPDIATTMPSPKSPDELRYWRDIAIALKALH